MNKLHGGSSKCFLHGPSGPPAPASRDPSAAHTSASFLRNLRTRCYSDPLCRGLNTLLMQPEFKEGPKGGLTKLGVPASELAGCSEAWCPFFRTCGHVWSLAPRPPLPGSPQFSDRGAGN